MARIRRKRGHRRVRLVIIPAWATSVVLIAAAVRPTTAAAMGQRRLGDLPTSLWPCPPSPTHRLSHQCRWLISTWALDYALCLLYLLPRLVSTSYSVHSAITTVCAIVHVQVWYHSIVDIGFCFNYDRHHPPILGHVCGVNFGGTLLVWYPQLKGDIWPAIPSWEIIPPLQITPPFWIYENHDFWSSLLTVRKT